MNQRRTFLQRAGRVLPAAAAAVIGAGALVRPAAADDGASRQFTGAWNTVHSLPFPPNSFREFLTLSDGGAVHETNTFLHTASNLDFSAFGLPNSVNASEGQGSWERGRQGAISVVFRKLLFDGARSNFGDLKATGLLQLSGDRLIAEWRIVVLDTTGNLIIDFGPATSEGKRIQ